MSLSLALPSVLDYSESHAQLPANMQCYSQTILPGNGSSFTPSSIIQFDIPSRGFLVPDSLYLRYKYTLASAVGAQIIGTPFATPFLRMETIFGSQNAETINQYNQVYNMLRKCTMDVSQLYGQQASWGFGNNTDLNIAMDAMDGRVCILNESGSFAGPLPGILSNSEKLIPMFLLPSCRVQLTMDTITNIFTTAVVPTGFTLTNLELCYQMLDAGAEIENSVRDTAMSTGGKLQIKSQSFLNSSVTLATGTVGSISLVYSQRLASVKAAFILFTGTTIGVNRWADAYDPTTNTGDIAINIGGQQYPQRNLSYSMNKTGLIQELRRAAGSLYDKTNSLSINAVEFNLTSGTASTLTNPASCIVGICLEKLHSHSLLTGISTQNSPITLQLNTGVATAQAHTVNMILNYDALIEIDVMNRQVSVKI